MNDPLIPKVSLATPKIAASPQRAVVVDWDARAEAWLGRQEAITFNAAGWTLFKPVLLALGLAWKNPKRYLEHDSDCPKHLWKLGNRSPKHGTDYKRAANKNGGNQGFSVRRPFLKNVLIEKYRAKLTSLIVSIMKVHCLSRVVNTYTGILQNAEGP